MFAQIIQSFIWVQTLVLALVAIIQALVSSAGLSEAFGSVLSAAEELKNPAREILEAAKLLSVRSQTIETHASELGRLAAALTNKEEDITAASQQKPRQGPIEPSFLKRLSKGGKIALYVASKANETDRPFVSYEIFQDKRMAFFVTGFLGALDALGIISLVTNKDGGDKVESLGQLSWLPQHTYELTAFKSDKRGFVTGQIKFVDNYFSNGAEPSPKNK